METRHNDKSRVEALTAADAPAIIELFCNAFYDYPVMRMVLGDTGAEYGRQLKNLIELFVMRRVWNEDPLLGIYQDGKLAAAATLTEPQEKTNMPSTEKAQSEYWALLGSEAEARYKKLGKIWRGFVIEEAHYHVNMIGVHSDFQGQGLAGRIMRVVHEMSAKDDLSAGVSLSTENPANVNFYKYWGYDVIDHEVYSDALETWGFYRKDDGGS